jgi:gp6-like head-tail connector protein
MATGDLTTLPHVKEWLGIDPDVTDGDALLSRMITAASRFVLGYLNRASLAAMTINDVYDGHGNNFMILRQWPVISLSTIQFYGITVDQPATGNPRSNGYLLEDAQQAGGQQRLTLFGHFFPNGRSVINITYRAGYLMTDEAYTIPSVTPWQITTTSLWLEDEGVSYALGDIPLVKVDSDPIVGQYSVDATGIYTFAEADEDEDILISYSYVPADIEQATYEMVGEQFKYKDRIGYISKSLAGQETVTFSQKNMTDYVKLLLQPYMRVVPA